MCIYWYLLYTIETTETILLKFKILLLHMLNITLFFFLLFILVYKMKCSILWKENKNKQDMSSVLQI